MDTTYWNVEIVLHGPNHVHGSFAFLVRNRNKIISTQGHLAVTDGTSFASVLQPLRSHCFAVDVVTFRPQSCKVVHAADWLPVLIQCSLTAFDNQCWPNSELIGGSFDGSSNERVVGNAARSADNESRHGQLTQIFPIGILQKGAQLLLG